MMASEGRKTRLYMANNARPISKAKEVQEKGNTKVMFMPCKSLTPPRLYALLKP
jgi:hypothetical protein